MSDLWEDDLLTEDDLRKLRPEPEPTAFAVVEGEPEPEVGGSEVHTAVPPVVVAEEEPWEPLLMVLPWVGVRSRAAVSSVWEELSDHEWHWQAVVADKAATETGMDRLSVLRMLRKLMQGGAVERREQQRGVVEIRLREMRYRPSSSKEGAR